MHSLEPDGLFSVLQLPDSWEDVVSYDVLSGINVVVSFLLHTFVYYSLCMPCMVAFCCCRAASVCSNQQDEMVPE